MKSLLVLLAAGYVTVVAFGAARWLSRQPETAARLRRSVWLVATASALVVAVLVARMLGLFTVPALAVVFVPVAVVGRVLLGGTKSRRAASTRATSARPPRGRPAALLARHEIVVLTFLVVTVAVCAVFVASVSAAR